ncbi:hypothetical protein Q8A67_015596 [Cirrhinus molitorella]|uniref:Uncharacterized protein n=1 Tax=Cirrhinus molitorella TaxID=172907 RepID=A0AA88PM27_9TELE|nr:hypothetical protein Q8A67_015596 [Cirrhinus molitorella]
MKGPDSLERHAEESGWWVPINIIPAEVMQKFEFKSTRGLYVNTFTWAREIPHLCEVEVYAVKVITAHSYSNGFHHVNVVREEGQMGVLVILLVTLFSGQCIAEWTENLALVGKAVQSSTHGTNGDAQHAVDGDRNSDYHI